MKASPTMHTDNVSVTVAFEYTHSFSMFSSPSCCMTDGFVFAASDSAQDYFNVSIPFCYSRALLHQYCLS